MDDFDKSNGSSNDGATPDSLPIQAPATGRALTIERRSQELALDLRPQIAEPEQEADGIDLRRIWAIVFKRRWTVLAVLLVVMAATTTATMLTVPLYRASASIQIEREPMKVVHVEGVMPNEGMDASFYETQYELLRSRNLALRVAKELKLRDHPVSKQMMAPDEWSRFKVWVGSIVKPEAPAAEKAAAPPPSRNATDPDLPYAKLVQAYIGIEPVAKSRMVRVHFISPDPKYSQMVANGVADAFIKMTLERRIDASSFAGKFLEERLAQLRIKLEDSERQLIEYSQREQIVNLDESASLVNQNLNATNAALSEAERERITLEAGFEQMRRFGPGSLPQVLDSKLIQTLKENRAAKQAEYSEKLATFKPAFPAMLQLKNQITEIDRQIAAETNAARGQVEAQYRAAAERERLLRARLTELKTEANDRRGRSVDLGILKREVDTNREIYDGLLQRYKEVGLAGGVGTNNVSIVDRAEPGYKFKPSLSSNLSMALFMGLFGGILLAMLLEYLDDSVKSPDDVEKHLKLPILGLIPRLNDKTTPAIALGEVRSAFAEAYRSVRTALQFSTSDGVPKILFITSPAATEGKSTTAYALANNFAQLGKRVLLVDCDMRNPSLHRLFKHEGPKGLSNYLAGEAQPSEILKPTNIKGLLYVPTGPLPPNPAELLAGPRMATFLTLAGEKFDQVIVDGPPVLGLADALIISNMAAGTLMIIGCGATRINYAKGSLKRLLAARARLVGVVLTKYEARKNASAYGYGYGYGYGEYQYYSQNYGPEQKKLTTSA